MSAADPQDSFNKDRAELFEALGHPTRIKILRALAASPLTHSDLKRAIGIDSNGLLAFHLNKLDGLIKTAADGLYSLSDEGNEALHILFSMSGSQASNNPNYNGSAFMKLTVVGIGLIGLSYFLPWFVLSYNSLNFVHFVNPGVYFPTMLNLIGWLIDNTPAITSLPNIFFWHIPRVEFLPLAFVPLSTLLGIMSLKFRAFSLFAGLSALSAGIAYSWGGLSIYIQENISSVYPGTAVAVTVLAGFVFLAAFMRQPKNSSIPERDSSPQNKANLILPKWVSNNRRGAVLLTATLISTVIVVTAAFYIPINHNVSVWYGPGGIGISGGGYSTRFFYIPPDTGNVQLSGLFNNTGQDPLRLVIFDQHGYMNFQMFNSQDYDSYQEWLDNYHFGGLIFDSLNSQNGQVNLTQLDAGGYFILIMGEANQSGHLEASLLLQYSATIFGGT